MKKNLWMIVVLLLPAGCAAPARHINLTDIAPVTPVMQAPPAPQTAGSLWTEARGGLFQDMKGRTVGDIITVVIVESASASKEAKTETGRSSNMSAGITSMLGLERNVGSITGINPASLVDAKTTSDFKGSGKTSRKENLLATLTTQVVEVLPNGNLRIEGNKTVTVNSETQIVTLSGIVRQPDVSPRNIVDSKNILNARIAYVGDGVISDKQQQGWLVRALDQVWPF
ncbi:MAG: flagellar basal body L-ring protein FlgH [Deltaproteobacteria bacterium]|nr:flagellar basal body L-ring protein FlgH [Deltaproteobacteria bacterium]